MKDIQYPYAYDEENNLVCINDVTDEDRQSHEYHCPNCGRKMVARLGQKNAHCFAHDGDSCGKESYLHKVAKEIIVKKYNTGHFPVILQMTRECSEQCAYLKEKCSLSELVEYNLAEIYDLPPRVEQSITVCETRFVPDVTFYSSVDSNLPICIEIFYKHSCSERKLQMCNNVIEIKVTQFADLLELENRIIVEEQYNHEDTSCYPASFINFDRIIPSRSEIFENNHPMCFWTVKELSDYRLQIQKMERADALGRSTWSRLLWYESGKCFLTKILEGERSIHKKCTVFELTMNHIGSHDDDMDYLIDRAVEIYPKLRRCKNCFHCQYNESNAWCDIPKNGSLRKGTFNEVKARYCKYYVNRFTTGPAVELWEKGWAADQVQIFPAKMEEDGYDY